jgi:hypothetical protein
VTPKKPAANIALSPISLLFGINFSTFATSS